MWGTPTLSFSDLWQTLFNGHQGSFYVFVWESRLPRFVLGVMAGALLAISGVLLQDSMRNALAGPELLGVSTGSAVVMAAIIILGIPIGLTLQPWLALAGGVIGGGVVLLASWQDLSPLRIILIGVAVTSFLQAIIVVIINLGGEVTIGLYYQYMVGGLENRTWTDVRLVLPWIVTVPMSLGFAKTLNILRLGDDVAKGLGTKVMFVRLCIVVLSIGMVAPVVATCGPISYIALLAPHATRRLIKTHNTRWVLPVSALLGATLLTGADLLAREAFSPMEIPVGVWTTLLGGPLLLLLLEHRWEANRS